MNIREGLDVLRRMFPNYHSTVVEEAVYYGGLDGEVKTCFKAYVAGQAGWSEDCETVELAVANVVGKAIISDGKAREGM